MQVEIEPGSRVEAIYGSTSAFEQYYCNFGLNPDYQQKLHEAGLCIVGRDANGEARIPDPPEAPVFRRYFVRSTVDVETRPSASADPGFLQDSSRICPLSEGCGLACSGRSAACSTCGTVRCRAGAPVCRATAEPGSRFCEAALRKSYSASKTRVLRAASRPGHEIMQPGLVNGRNVRCNPPRIFSKREDTWRSTHVSMPAERLPSAASRRSTTCFRRLFGGAGLVGPCPRGRHAVPQRHADRRQWRLPGSDADEPAEPARATAQGRHADSVFGRLRRGDRLSKYRRPARGRRRRSGPAAVRQFSGAEERDGRRRRRHRCD